MKKKNLYSLKLNKQSIVGFANQLNGGYASSGLNMSCPNICKMTQEDRLLCNDLDLPSPMNPAPSESASEYETGYEYETPADSPAG